VTRVQTRRRSSKFKDRKIQGTSHPGGTSSRLTRVVYLLHVKEPQAPRGPLSKITGHYPSKYIVSNSSDRWFRRSLVGGASGAIALRWTYNRSYRGRGAWGIPPLKYHTIPNGKALIGHVGPYDFETSRLPHFLHKHLRDGGEIVNLMTRPTAL
jgi:hypothetical protein